MTMKKILSIIAISFALHSYGQNPIPNPGFEEWNPFDNYEEPQGWGSTNAVTGDFVVKPVQPDTVSIEGSSAKLVTKSGYNLSLPGVLCSNGYYNTNTSRCSGGFPISESYVYFNGYGMYNPKNGDTGIIYVRLTRWDPQTNHRVTVASAEVNFSKNNPVFDYFSVPLTYISSDAPDTALIEIRSTKKTKDIPKGSKLRVDNLEFAGFTSVENPETVTMEVYPNPSNENVSIHLSPTPEKLYISIFDVVGRRISQHFMPANEIRISTELLPTGLYYLHVTDSNHKKITGCTLQVQH